MQSELIKTIGFKVIGIIISLVISFLTGYFINKGKLRAQIEANYILTNENEKTKSKYAVDLEKIKDRNSKAKLFLENKQKVYKDFYFRLDSLGINECEKSLKHIKDNLLKIISSIHDDNILELLEENTVDTINMLFEGNKSTLLLLQATSSIKLYCNVSILNLVINLESLLKESIDYTIKIVGLIKNQNSSTEQNFKILENEMQCKGTEIANLIIQIRDEMRKDLLDFN